MEAETLAIVELEILEEGPASEVLGSPASPFDVPHMSIWDAVYWVARAGEARDFDVNNRSVWDNAITAAVDRIRAGDPMTAQGRSGLARTAPANAREADAGGGGRQVAALLACAPVRTRGQSDHPSRGCSICRQFLRASSRNGREATNKLEWE